MLLTVNNLGKEFTLHLQQKRKIKAISKVSFALNQGEFMCLLGPSGAGKSTILKCIYRTYLPSQGEIIYAAPKGLIHLEKAPEETILELRQKDIGYVSQFLKVLPRISALEIVAKPLLDLGTDKETAYAKAQEMLLLLGIKKSLHQVSPFTFSGGEQQRVNIAKGIIAPKRLLLLDEPTASLDRERKKIVIHLLSQLKQQGITMIGIFHELDLVDKIADKFLDLKEVSNESNFS